MQKRSSESHSRHPPSTIFHSLQSLPVSGHRRSDDADALGRYHFLLQSEPDVLSLDDYVLNTGTFRSAIIPYSDSPVNILRHVRLAADQSRSPPIHRQPRPQTRFPASLYAPIKPRPRCPRTRYRRPEMGSIRPPHKVPTAHESERCRVRWIRWGRSGEGVRRWIWRWKT